MTNYLPKKINSFTRKLYSIEHGTPLKAAENPNRKLHLSLYRRDDIHNVEIFAPDLHCNTMLISLSELCFNFGNGVRYQRVP